jgi:hypothetical protein
MMLLLKSEFGALPNGVARLLSYNMLEWNALKHSNL